MRYTRYQVQISFATISQWVLAWCYSHSAQDKQGSNTKLLAHSQAKLEYFHDRENENHNIHDEVWEDGAEEDHRVWDLARATRYILIPICRDWPTTKRYHEDT
jgi:hypothetical protein